MTLSDTAYAEWQAMHQSKADALEALNEAKFGMFIHWGLYAIPGGVWKGQTMEEEGIGPKVAEWIMRRRSIPRAEYAALAEQFNPVKFDADTWAEIAAAAGMKYMVITSKHHDGFALWDSKYGELNVMKSPAGRDLIQPFVKALRKNKLKVGLYYSLPDWSYIDYPNLTRNQKRYSQDSLRWGRFLHYYQGQLKELSTRFDPDLYWFDGDWEFSADQWQAEKVRSFLLEQNPNAIINSRLGGYGDYATPEQGVPIVRPESKYWELCMTMNNSWGFQGNDRDYKTPNQVIRIFTDCISMGGNLLLDIGPKADGTIPEEQVNILKELGRWTDKHKEAIYGSKAGLPPGHFYGPSTLSKDGEILYLFLTQKPDHPIVIKGLKNQINRIRIVGEGTKLSHKVVGKMYWSEVPGLLYIDVPQEKLDPQVTVIALQLKGKIDLYREDGQVIESN